MGFMFTLGRFARKIWNGPFYIGKVTRPASVGDVLMKLLETGWRFIILLLGVLAAGAASVATWAEVIEPRFFPPLEKQIKISAHWDDGKASVATVGKKPFRCSPDYPVMVTLENRSQRTVGEVEFAIDAREVNRSTILTESGFSRKADSIIKPGYVVRQCWSVPLESWVSLTPIDSSKLTYYARILWATEFGDHTE